MFLWLILFLIIVGILVVYLSLEKEKNDNLNLKNYKDPEIVDEFKNIDIKNEDIKRLYERVKEYIV